MAGRCPFVTGAACRSQVRGFTMIELLAVLGILAVLLVMALPFAELTARREREAELRHGLWEIRDAIDAYKRMADAGLIQPSTKSGYPPDLQTLVAGVKTNTATTAYFLRSVPQDPFAASAPDGAGHCAAIARPRIIPRRARMSSTSTRVRPRSA